jgi:hypothetical protein
MSKLLIGADPEFFVRRKAHYVSGHIFKCGTKRRPLETPHGHVQVDGIALEVNVKPSGSREEFITNVRDVMGDVTAVMRNHAPDARLVAKPSIFFGTSKLSALPMENFILGCDPDYNAWDNNRPMERPNPEVPFRTGAGHIHIGWTQNENPRNYNHMLECARIVRQLDYYLGVPSLLWDKDTRRRTLYGRAGAFRPKSYGVEYRVLSNAWVTTDKLIGWVFDRAVAAVTDVWAGRELEKTWGQWAATIIDQQIMDWNARHTELSETLLK